MGFISRYVIISCFSSYIYDNKLTTLTACCDIFRAVLCPEHLHPNNTCYHHTPKVPSQRPGIGVGKVVLAPVAWPLPLDACNFELFALTFHWITLHPGDLYRLYRVVLHGRGVPSVQNIAQMFQNPSIDRIEPDISDGSHTLGISLLQHPHRKNLG